MLKLSHSSISTYGSCPFKWKLKYVDRMKEKPKHYFSFGLAIHAALEFMYGGERCPNECAVQEAFMSAWSSSGYKDLKAEMKAQREGKEMLDRFYTAFAPTWAKPLAVESKFTFTIDHVTVTGFIDRVDILPDGALHVLDYKTGRALEPGREAEDPQLTMYQLAAEHLFPESKVGRVSFLHVPSLAWATAPPRLPGQRDALRSAILSTAAAITAQQFPCKPSEPSCQWCDFKSSCPAWRP